MESLLTSGGLRKTSDKRYRSIKIKFDHINSAHLTIFPLLPVYADISRFIFDPVFAGKLYYSFRSFFDAQPGTSPTDNIISRVSKHFLSLTDKTPPIRVVKNHLRVVKYCNLWCTKQYTSLAFTFIKS